VLDRSPNFLHGFDVPLVTVCCDVITKLESVCRTRMLDHDATRGRTSAVFVIRKSI